MSKKLLEMAIKARSNAYAPYSKFYVGAALQDIDGNVYIGCNVENCAYGSTICAERHAVGAAMVSGARKFKTIVIVTDAPTITTCCGACLQVLSEARVNDIVFHNLRTQETVSYNLNQLLPAACDLDYLKDNIE